MRPRRIHWTLLAAVALTIFSGCARPAQERAVTVEVLATDGSVPSSRRLQTPPRQLAQLRPPRALARNQSVIAYVNGLPVPAAAGTRLFPGDLVQWLVLPEGAPTPPALVGAFPAPLLRGFGGKRLPVRLECAPPSGWACELVERRIAALGTPASRGLPGAVAAAASVRVVVGRWSALASLRALGRLTEPPNRSGLPLRIGPRAIALYDAFGRQRRRLGPGSGVVAALIDTSRAEAPGEGYVLVVTGLDEDGVERAAKLLERRALRGAVAVAADRRRSLRLPLATGPLAGVGRARER